MSHAVPSVSTPLLARVLAVLMAPAVLIFISSNFVNVGNLAFNMIFSRLMGPELFGLLALLLTIKLSLLGLLGAVQTAVSKVVANLPDAEISPMARRLSRVNQRLLAVGVVSVIPFAGFGLLWQGAPAFGLPDLHLLAVLILALPFGASLSLLRGFALGQMDAKRIVISSNVEMIIRLVGALLAWSLGFGITGVVAAISVSIIAGWVVLMDMLPKRALKGLPIRPITTTVLIAAAPFALLQLAQVLALDGEIFVARSLLPASEVGFIAALSLVQRIQFFACFALASVLLPGVVLAARRNENLVGAVRPVALLFGAVSIPLIVVALFKPTLILGVLVGDAYFGAANALSYAVIAAVAFTFSYLAATFLAALDMRLGITLILGAAVMQMGALVILAPATVLGVVQIKLAVQLVTALLIAVVSMRSARKYRAQV
ncbi:hypothetical protein [Celeribacter arenosi]|uniref:Polysaccharide biosynthesis protein n=1 Tax=Celeribacter arenosi TaxID=792649 RepID=A0ABP7K1Z5_9RHOB